MTRLSTWAAVAGLAVALAAAGGCKSDRTEQTRQPTLGGDATGPRNGVGNDQSMRQSQNDSVNSLH